MKLVVTIPAQNEQATIGNVIAGIPRKIAGIHEVEIIVVNDGSTDATADAAAQAGALVVTLHNRPGLGKVFKTGLERAMRRGADIIVNIDGDGQFNPTDIEALIRPVLSDEADFVTCSRFADPKLRPEMPLVKFIGNRVVTHIINWVCGGTKFTDVSCGFRAFNREAAYRLTLFGKFTYTQETFIDLFSKGMRITEVPLHVRGVREYGESRVASNVLRYATSSLPIILRAMRDIQPLKFFGGIAMIFFLFGILTGGFVTGYYIVEHRTTPYTSLIVISGVLITLSFLLGVLALLADMLGRHRMISEELLYLARRKIYAGKRVPRTILASVDPEQAVAKLFEEPWAEDLAAAESEDSLSVSRG
jgi:glycosyltransferase involved in cell wall biosynthesis